MVNIVFYCNGTHKFILEKMCYYFNYSNYSKLYFCIPLSSLNIFLIEQV